MDVKVFITKWHINKKPCQSWCSKLRIFIFWLNYLFHKNCKIFKSLVYLGAFVCSIVRDGKKFTDWLILLHQTDTLSYSSNTPTKKEWEWLNNLKEHVEKCVWEKTNLSFYNFSAHSELVRHSAHLIWKDSSKYRIRIMLLSRSLQKNCFVFRSETC